MQKAYIPYVTTLKEIHEEISEGIFPFIFFETVKNMQGQDVVVIPFARFRESDRKGVVEVRSCDCGGSVCGMPTKYFHIPEEQMNEWFYVQHETNVRYLFRREIR